MTRDLMEQDNFPLTSKRYSTSERISESLLQEHALSLKGVPKDIFEDFVLYIQMTELDSRLL